MSYNSIYQAYNDNNLRNRLTACTLKEANDPNPQGAVATGQNFARAVRANPTYMIENFMWPLCVKFEDQYASAIANVNAGVIVLKPGETIGSREDVITDVNIRNIVRTNWPQD